MNDDFADISYAGGWCPTSRDAELYDALRVVLNDELARWPHLCRWHINMTSFTQEERLAFPAAAETPLAASLAAKVERLKSTRYISKSMLDKKVRQPVACCKQSCHKLLRKLLEGKSEGAGKDSSGRRTCGSFCMKNVDVAWKTNILSF